MSEQAPGSRNVHVAVGGANTGAIVAGDLSEVQSTVSITTGAPTPEELAELRARLRTEVIAPLERQVAVEAPPEVRDEALEQVAELQEAATAEQPDVSTMAYVIGWFKRHAPKIAGTVASVVVNPIVGRLVEAGGDAAVAEFTRRFGKAE